MTRWFDNSLLPCKSGPCTIIHLILSWFDFDGRSSFLSPFEMHLLGTLARL